MPKLPFTTWYGNLLKISTPLPMTSRPKGLVLHITDGVMGKNKVPQIPNLLGLVATFNSTNFPSHFGIDAQGQIGQYIDTDRQDRATERGTEWFSVECCCYRGMALTDAQVTAAGFLFALLRENYKSFELRAAQSVAETGLAYHSLFLTEKDKGNPNKHWGCPGPLVIAQRDLIIERAQGIFA
jgi:hypothetical protein